MKFIEISKKDQETIIRGLKGFDYSTLSADKINIIPPETVAKKWKNDCVQMCNEMMYGDYPEYDELIDSIRALQNRLNKSL